MQNTYKKNNTASKESMASEVTRWVLPIAAWSIWEENPQDRSPPDIRYVNAGLRRKVSTLTKMSLKAANDCVGDYEAVRVVYASQHGDLSKTTKMLDNLAKDEALSPTDFSMSVLNTFSGVFSIAKKETQPSNSISSGFSSFGFGLLEAYLQLKNNPDTPVLYVYADEPAPEQYQVINQQFSPHALAILLARDAKPTVECIMACKEGQETDEPQSHSFIRCLQGESSGQWRGEGREWVWKNNG